VRGAPRLPAACLFFSGAPVLLAGVTAAPTVRANWTELFFYFLKIGSVLFGSGYVLLAFIRQGLVHELHWLTEQQLLDAVAAGQFTPGPLFSTAAFVGYVVGGWQGAVAASVGIFLPSFLLVWVTHPLVKRLREARWSAGFLDGLNAGSVALMAGVLVQLARAALGGHWTAWLILAGAAALQFRTRLNSAWIVVLAALVGLLMHR
jgi:chromate transporter